MKGRWIRWTQDELTFIEARAGLPRAELFAAFKARFDRPEVSQSNLTALCKRKRWLTGRDGRFAPGHEPTGGGNPLHPNCVATRFRKGNRTGRANHVYKPIGTERMSKDGYLERKVHDGLPMQSRWRAVHLIEWEAVNGPVPKGHALKCLDGDRTNADPENWIAVPRALLPRLSGRWRMNYDTAPEELKPTLLAIADLEHKARLARKKKEDAA